MKDFSDLVAGLRSQYKNGKTKSIEWRRCQLEAVVRLLDDNVTPLCDALYKDLQKHRFETMGMELLFSRNSCVEALNKLNEWTKPVKVEKNLPTMMDTCFIQYEPYGVALIIGAWNYPLQLILCPLIGALAAGNCCILKPSEVCMTTSNLLAKLIPQYLDKDCIKVVEGPAEDCTALLNERFDLIFYTGSTGVARIIMQAAAKNVTPVILELGGKSPCFVDAKVDLEIVAQRLLWGKCANVGQTCVAPDYVMCTSEVQENLIEKLKKTIENFYGSNPVESESLGRIVNQRHLKRLEGLLRDANIVAGGEVDGSQLFIGPTVLRDVKTSDKIMQEEVFGPLLPIVPVSGAKEAIDFIKSGEKPLALYVFSNDKKIVRTFLDETSSGSVCVNDCIMQGALSTLPFGGVGNSGTGSYHGRFSFEAFSHKRAVMWKELALEKVNSIRYPPYSMKKEAWMTWLLRVNRKSDWTSTLLWPLCLLATLLAVVMRFLGLQNIMPAPLKKMIKED